MRPISPEEIPFVTTNTALAYCLYNAGVPFMNDAKPCSTEYDIDILNGFREPDNTATYDDMDIQQATIAAHADGKKGRLKWLFRPVPDIDRLTRAYAAQEKELADGEGTAQELKHRIMLEFKAGEITEAEAILRSDCITLKMRQEFTGMWKHICPDIYIQKTGKTVSAEWSGVRDGKRVQGTVTRRPGCIVIPANASESVKKHLKV